MTFDGVLAYVGRPSDAAPEGCRGHRCLLTREAVEKSLPSLNGSPLHGYPFTWERHCKTRLGVIEAAWLDEDELSVRGSLIPMRPSHEESLRSLADLGMSFDAEEAHIEDMRAAVWKIVQITFTGAAIVLREKAAYRNSQFTLR